MSEIQVEIDRDSGNVINHRASVNGREVTNDNLMPGLADVVLPRRRVETTLAGGFRHEWITGTSDNGEEFRVTSGAGLGSPWLILEVTMADGTERSEMVDMRDLLPRWLERVIEEGPTPAQPTEGN